MNLTIEKLKTVVKERHDEGTPDNAIINAIKGELQYFVLEFISNNQEYSHLVMYGGTLLRIAYGLSRMSEDLDFQTSKKFNFQKFKKELATYFKKTYGLTIEVKEKAVQSATTRVAFINFPRLLEDIGMKGHGIPTILKIRFDVNDFDQTENFATETISIVKDTLAFSIKTYPLSTLMASKIAAVLLRTKRGIGSEISQCKPRDIYDLMWYMGQKIVPNLEYLKAIHTRVGQDFTATNVLGVFDLLTRRVMNLDDKLFQHDLAPFFYNPAQFEEWHHNWKERFMILKQSYSLYEVKKIGTQPALESILVGKDFDTENRQFRYVFSTEEPGKEVTFTCVLSEYWYRFPEFKIMSGYRRNDIKFHLDNIKLTELDYEYLGLFYTKIEDYLKRSDYVVLQPDFKTKVIRATSDNLNLKTEIFLDRRLLIKETLENLF